LTRNAANWVKLEKNDDISGNIDSRKIKDFADSLGFSARAHHVLKKGAKLLEVKIQRNNLAHGNISFAKCGRDYSFEDLEKTKAQVVGYPRKILSNIQLYLNNEGYKR